MSLSTKNTCFWIIIVTQFLTACIGGAKKNKSSSSQIPAVSSINTIQFKGLENPTTSVAIKSTVQNQVQAFAGDRYTPQPEALKDPTSSPLPVPVSSPVRVIVTFKEESTGAIKKVFSGIGVQSLDLSDVPDGAYFVTAEVEGGFRPPQPKRVEVRNGEFDTFELAFEKIGHNDFYYYWESDNNGRAFEYSANEEVAPIIEILDENVEIPQFSPVQTLRNKYNIVLGNKEVAWSYELASTLLRTIEDLPHEKLSEEALFTLTDKEINNDISFHNNGDGWSVVLSSKAFAYASKKVGQIKR